MISTDYRYFRQAWFLSLSEEIKREMNSMYCLDLKEELELLCQEEYAKIHENK